MEHCPKIEETLEEVRQISFEEKKEAVYDEGKINSLLDKILDFKKDLSDKTDKMNNLLEKIERVTWYKDDHITSDTLMKINDLISAMRDLHSSLIRQWVSYKFLRTKGIAKAETKSFKLAIDDFKETASDLESRFFFLPKMPSFTETTKELSLL